MAKLALMIACMEDHREVVEVLLAGGADVNAGTNNGASALTAATRKGYADLRTSLVAGGGHTMKGPRSGLRRRMAAFRGHAPAFWF